MGFCSVSGVSSKQSRKNKHIQYVSVYWRNWTASTDVQQSSGQDEAVHLHLKDKGDSSEVQNTHILDEDRWTERRVNEAIYVLKKKKH